MADAPPPGYTSTSMIPSAGGIIHAMHGGGDGVPPPGYQSSSLLPSAGGELVPYRGGANISNALGAANKMTNAAIQQEKAQAAAVAATAVSTSQNVPSNEIMSVVATSAVAANKAAKSDAAKSDAAKTDAITQPAVQPVAQPAVQPDTQPIISTSSVPGVTTTPNKPAEKPANKPIEKPAEKPSQDVKSITPAGKKPITLFGRTLSIGPSADGSWIIGEQEKEALKRLGVDEAPGHELLQKEVLQALYDGTCDTDLPISMLLDCEPIRRLIQSLSIILLEKLKEKSAISNVKKPLPTEIQKARILFVPSCKTAKQIIDAQKADIVCTQGNQLTLQDYNVVHSCGDNENVLHIYLKKDLPAVKKFQCSNDASAVVINYQGVIIANMSTFDQNVINNDNPDLIIGRFDPAPEALSKWAHQSSFWYKPESDPNLDKINLIESSDLECNAAVATIQFKQTFQALAQEADKRAEEAAKQAKNAAESMGDATQVEPSAKSMTEQSARLMVAAVNPDVKNSQSSKPIPSFLQDTTATDNATRLKQHIDYFNQELSDNEKELIKQFNPTTSDINENRKTEREAFQTLFEITNLNSYQTLATTRNSKAMLLFLKNYQYRVKKDGTLSKKDTLQSDFEIDITRYPSITFVSDTFSYTSSEGLPKETYTKFISPIIKELEPTIAEIVYCFKQGLFGIVPQYLIDSHKLSDHSSWSQLEQNTLFAIHKNKIVFHDSRLYQLKKLINNNSIDSELYLAYCTVEIDRTTLDGTIQMNFYDITTYIDHKIITILHDEFNNKTNKENAKKRVLHAMLNRIRDRMLTRTPDSGKNIYAKSLLTNVTTALDSDINVIRYLIDLTKTDGTSKSDKFEKLLKNGTSFENKSKITAFLGNWMGEIESITGGSILTEKESTQILLSRIISDITPNGEKEILDAVREFIKESKLHKTILSNMIIEVTGRIRSLLSNFENKQRMNQDALQKLSSILQKNELSWLLEKIKTFREMDKESWLPVYKLFQIMDIYDDVSERKKYHRQLYEQTIEVFNANLECVDAYIQYRRYHALYSVLWMSYAIIYEQNNPILHRSLFKDLSCDIPDKDSISPAVEELKETVERIAEKNQPISKEDINEIKIELQEIQQTEEHDAFMNQIAAAAVAALFNEQIDFSNSNSSNDNNDSNGSSNHHSNLNSIEAELISENESEPLHPTIQKGLNNLQSQINSEQRQRLENELAALTTEKNKLEKQLGIKGIKQQLEQEKKKGRAGQVATLKRRLLLKYKTTNYGRLQTINKRIEEIDNELLEQELKNLVAQHNAKNQSSPKELSGISLAQHQGVEPQHGEQILEEHTSTPIVSEPLVEEAITQHVMPKKRSKYVSVSGIRPNTAIKTSSKPIVSTNPGYILPPIKTTNPLNQSFFTTQRRPNPSATVTSTEEVTNQPLKSKNAPISGNPSEAISAVVSRSEPITRTRPANSSTETLQELEKQRKYVNSLYVGKKQEMEKKLKELRKAKNGIEIILKESINESNPNMSDRKKDAEQRLTYVNKEIEKLETELNNEYNEYIKLMKNINKNINSKKSPIPTLVNSIEEEPGFQEIDRVTKSLNPIMTTQNKIKQNIQTIVNGKIGSKTNLSNTFKKQNNVFNELKTKKFGSLTNHLDQVGFDASTPVSEPRVDSISTNYVSKQVPNSLNELISGKRPNKQPVNKDKDILSANTTNKLINIFLAELQAKYRNRSNSPSEMDKIQKMIKEVNDYQKQLAQNISDYKSSSNKNSARNQLQYDIETIERQIEKYRKLIVGGKRQHALSFTVKHSRKRSTKRTKKQKRLTHKRRS